MNHKWIDDQCSACGLKRKKAYRWLRTSSYLSRAGIWEDRQIYSDYAEWAFSFNGKAWQFDRPDCQKDLKRVSVTAEAKPDLPE
jgi:hypothetical protein